MDSLNDAFISLQNLSDGGGGIGFPKPTVSLLRCISNIKECCGKNREEGCKVSDVDITTEYTYMVNTKNVCVCDNHRSFLLNSWSQNSSLWIAGFVLGLWYWTRAQSLKLLKSLQNAIILIQYFERYDVQPGLLQSH